MLYPQQDWREVMQDVAEAIDNDLGGEPIVITSIREAANVNAQPTRDASREPFETVAIFHNRALSVPLGGGTGGGYVNEIALSTSGPCFSIRFAALPPWPVKRQDRIHLCRTGALYEVKDVRPDGVSRIVAECVILGREVGR